MIIDPDGSNWVSVFGQNLILIFLSPAMQHSDDDAGNFIGKNEWLGLFGGEPLGSPFQDGHYVYQVVAGSGAGSKAESPILYIGRFRRILLNYILLFNHNYYVS